jgi:hypothetical protein
MTRRRTQGGVSARSGSAGVDRSGRGVQLDLPYGASSCVGGGFERARGSSTASQGDAAQLLLVLGRC